MKATFAAGCFWGVEEAFRTLKGVKKTTVGYTGGRTKNPTYLKVCTHLTGHAEAVEIEFEEKQISYADLLKVFWRIHDPTQRNRQGLDIGPQYRSSIFYHNERQKVVAEGLRQEIEAAGIWDDPIVTEVAPLGDYFRAEDYHQEYFRRNPAQGYCRVIIAPKVAKFREQNLNRLKQEFA